MNLVIRSQFGLGFFLGFGLVRFFWVVCFLRGFFLLRFGFNSYSFFYSSLFFGHVVFPGNVLFILLDLVTLAPSERTEYKVNKWCFSEESDG